MKAATSTTIAIEQQSFNSQNYVDQQQSLNPRNCASNFSERSLDTLDETDLELERIMFEEFAHGLPSDIPMADF